MSPMPDRYKYKAVSETGEHTSGIISAPGIEQVEEHLRKRRLLPVRIKALGEKKPFPLFGLQRDADYERLIMFTTSLSTMHRAGIPILRALSVIHVGKPGSRLQYIVDRIQEQVRSGRLISEAMANYSDVFSPVYTASVAAGEESGRLEHTLDELAEMLERQLELNRHIKTAVRYPLIVVGVIFAAFFVLMNFVIPRFVSFYSSFDAELPWATKVIIAISNFVSGYWPLILAGAAVLAVGFKKFIDTPNGRRQYDRLLLRLPVLGDLTIKGNVARFCLMFRILFKSGLPLVQSLSILSGTVKNTIIGQEITRLEELFRRGRDIESLRGDFEYFPAEALQMLAVGLESGNLERMLRELANHYSRQVLYTSRHLTSIIEPALTLVMAVFVLILALAIFLPMWNLITVFSG